MVGQAARLVDRLDPALYTRWGKPGLRAQLVDLNTKSLVMDFLIEGDARSRHVLNAVSPGFTCSIPFAAHVCDGIPGL
ncbi:MAG: L-2-hydroxyglutarate oxidase, partial [Elusimicrobia bacterium]|nr:L-2-hydroxyglutarate oxidase [Elusimicrobiota bacterium]